MEQTQQTASPPPLSETLPVAALVLGASAIGTAPILVRLAEDHAVGPSAAAFWRLVLALPVLAIWAHAAGPQRTGPQSGARAGNGRRALMYSGLAGLLFAGDLITWHAGIVRTTAANATLLPNMTPVVLAIAAVTVWGERLSRSYVAALALAVLGAILLTGANLSTGGEALVGDGLSAITAVWYAGYLLAVKEARRAWSAASVMAVSTLIAAPPTLGAALVFGENLLPTALGGWVWLVLLGIFAHAGGQGGIAFGLGRLPAGFSSLVVLVQPIIAATLGWVVFKEALGPIQLGGAALILVGIAVARRSPAAV